MSWRVKTFIFALFPGISDCITAKDRGLLTTRVNIESDMNRLISVLNASGIDVTLVSSDDISYEVCFILFSVVCTKSYCLFYEYNNWEVHEVHSIIFIFTHGS